MKYLWLIPVAALITGSLFFGSVSLDIFDPQNRDIVLDLRLPRALFAFCVGAMLGLSGSVYQLVLRNPLADSFTTGAASSSALGAVLAISMGLSPTFVPPFAFVTGMLGLALVYRLSGGARGAVTLILCGVIVNIVASSMIGFTKFYFEESVTSVVFWLMGGFSFIDMPKLIIGYTVFIISYMYLMKKGSRLDMMAFDDSTAVTSGIDLKQERAGAFFFATLLVACAVSYSGLIGFVGLIVPHIARSIFRPNMRSNMFYSAVFGGLLLLASDTFVRTFVRGGAEMPVGIVTSILGGLFFFYILMRRRAEIWHD
ncbi:MAG: FecCD family ABC transporter permease [Deferribacterales bacterium]